MFFEIDINEYENNGDNSKYLIPEGTYLLKVMDVAPYESKKGRAQLRFRLDLQNLPEDWPYNDRVYHTLTLIPKGEKGHGLAVHFLKEFGIHPDDNGVMTFELEDFMERKIKAYIYQEKGLDARVYNRAKDWEFYLPEGTVVPQEQQAAPAKEYSEEVPF